MDCCLLRIAKAPALQEWGGMVYAEGDVLGGVGPCRSAAIVESMAREIWPSVLVEPSDNLRGDGEPLTGHVAIDSDQADTRI